MGLFCYRTTQMKYVAAYVLAVLGGSENPSAADVKKVLSSAGVSVDDAEVDKVISELKGKNVFDVIEEGKGKLSSVPTVAVSSGAAAPSGGASNAAAPAAAAAAEEEEEEEDEDDMGFGLFD